LNGTKFSENVLFIYNGVTLPKIIGEILFTLHKKKNPAININPYLTVSLKNCSSSSIYFNFQRSSF